MSSQPGGAADFGARLQAALGSAKGRSVKTAAPATAQPDSAPTDDQFTERLDAAMRQARGDSEQTAEAEPAAVSGPVGQGDYVARDGDCMASIAFDHGHFWETLWNDPGNSELQQVRQDPYVLLPGDRVTIPDKRRKDEQIAPEQRHRFRRRGLPETLRIRFLDSEGEPRQGVPYELDITTRGGSPFTPVKGKTDGDGFLQVFIPPDATEGEIKLGEGEEQEILPILLGHLDPRETMTGINARLRNLGFDCGENDDELDEQTRLAVMEFQEEHGLPLLAEDAEKIEADTVDRIDEVYSGSN